VRAQAELEGVREFECSTNPYGQRFLRRFEGLGSFRRKSLFVDARKLTIFELSIPGQAQAELGYEGSAETRYETPLDSAHGFDIRFKESTK
jgi:hypothetical protein